MFNGKNGNCMRHQLGTITKEKEPHGIIGGMQCLSVGEACLVPKSIPDWMPKHWKSTHGKVEDRNAKGFFS